MSSRVFTVRRMAQNDTGELNNMTGVATCGLSRKFVTSLGNYGCAQPCRQKMSATAHPRGKISTRQHTIFVYRGALQCCQMPSLHPLTEPYSCALVARTNAGSKTLMNDAPVALPSSCSLTPPVLQPSSRFTLLSAALLVKYVVLLHARCVPQARDVK